MPRGLARDPGEEHGRRDQVRGDQVDTAGDEVHRQKPEYGEEGPGTNYRGGREEREGPRTVLRGVVGRFFRWARLPPPDPPEQGCDQQSRDRDQGEAGEAGDGRRANPARSGPRANPRLPPTTKYEIVRPRSPSGAARLTVLRAIG